MAGILRSGKYWRCFAGLSRNVLNPAPGRSQQNRQTVLQSAPSMCMPVQKYASAAAQTSFLQVDRSVQRLENESRRLGRLSLEDIEKVLNEIRTTGRATASQSLMVIRSCGDLVPEELPEARMALVNEVWSTLKSLKVPLDISHYNALLRVYLENEHIFAPEDFLSEIEAKGLEPNRVTYQWLIRGFCQQGNINGATRILELMRSKNLPVNENVFNSLIMGHSQANDLESAKGIPAVMKQAGLEPSTDTYHELMCAFARHGDIEALTATLAECEKMEFVFLDSDMFDIVYVLAVNGHVNAIDDVLSKLTIGIGFNQDAINTILRLVNKRQEDIAFKILRLMPRPTRANGEPVDVGTFFIKQLIKANVPVEKVLYYCKFMQDENLNSRALVIAAGAALEAASIQQTLPLLREMKNIGLPVRQHYFWPVIAAAQPNEVLTVIRRMQNDFELNTSFETLREYALPRLRANNVGDLKKTLTTLRNVGVSNNSAVNAAAYAALCANSLRDAAEILAENRVFYPPSIFRPALVPAVTKSKDYKSFVGCVRQIYDNIPFRQRLSEEQDFENADGSTSAENVSDAQLHFLESTLNNIVTYTKNDAPAVLEQLLPLLAEEGLSVRKGFAERIITRLGSDITPQITEQLNKLSSGELELTPLSNNNRKRRLETLSLNEIERFIKNVESKGESASNLKRHLVGAALRNQNLPKAEEIIKRLEAEKFEIPLGVYAQLIDLYTIEKRTDEALALYRKLRTENSEFQLDNLKTLHLFEQLLAEEKNEEAFKLLTENPKSLLADDNDKWRQSHDDRIVFRILNTIAESRNAEKLQRTFDAFIKGNYLLPSNALLGPLIKVHLLNDDVVQALDTFESICLKYRCTPWKNELSRRLIQTEDAANLQRLTDLSTTIHGEVNSLYDLVFAFLSCGRLRQARKILETSGLRARTDRITLAAEHYRKEGNIEQLEALMEVTKGLSFVDRSEIANALLSCYTEVNSPHQALSLWMKMQEEDVVPSDQFLGNLANLLQRNSMDVPFVVPTAEIELPGPSSTNVPVKKPDRATVTDNVVRKFREHLSKGEIKDALLCKDELVANGRLNLNDCSRLIEILLRENQLAEAKECYEYLAKNRQFPRMSVFRFFLNKLAIAGDVDYVEQIGNRLDDSYKKLVSYDNRLCNATVAAGKADEFLQKLTDEIIAAKTPEEINKLALKFPSGGAIGLLESHPETLPRYQILAEEYAAKNVFNPINVLWQYYISNEKVEEAQAVWDKYLSNAPRLMFQRVLHVAREQENENIVKTIISQMRSGTFTENAIGLAYSCLLDIQAKKGDLNAALNTLEEGLKDIKLENINRTALLRLKSKLVDQGKDFPYAIPEVSSASSNDDSSSTIPRDSEQNKEQEHLQ